MRYTIVLICYVLCVAYSHTAKDFQYRNRLFPDVKISSEDEKFQQNQYNKIIIRERRSIWTDVMNHINSVIDNFLGKPLLAGVVDNLEAFDKNKFQIKHKSSNIMLKTGEKVDPVLTKKQKELKEDLDNIIQLHKEALQKEQDIKDLIVFQDPAFDIDELIHFYGLGIHHPVNKEVVDRYIVKFPSIKKEVLEGIPYLTSLRQEVELRERLLKQKLDFSYKDQKLKDSHLKNINDKLKDVSKYNMKWLDQYRHPKSYIPKEVPTTLPPEDPVETTTLPTEY